MFTRECGVQEAHEARAAWARARQLAPDWLRETGVTARFECGAEALDYTAASNTITAGLPSPLAGQTAPWLHEMAHAAMVGPRPDGPVERRIWAALEEGAADYVAAVILDEPDVGGRRLDHPAILRTVDWIGLGLLAFPFDAHSLGLAFGRALWLRRQVAPRALVACLARGAAGHGLGINGVLDGLAGCHVEGLDDALARWASPLRVELGIEGQPARSSGQDPPASAEAPARTGR